MNNFLTIKNFIFHFVWMLLFGIKNKNWNYWGKTFFQTCWNFPGWSLWDHKRNKVFAKVFSTTWLTIHYTKKHWKLLLCLSKMGNSLGECVNNLNLTANYSKLMSINFCFKINKSNGVIPPPPTIFKPTSAINVRLSIF